ncbi:unnamed protein product [Schistosoma mattheei]|uniref:Uncharacterized protein n=1 Tax=Schistosoma mattheei TaxID=31246 RepID=A0A183P213_9TREM|nr:unnamed protein product [Schistosoma mattheei]
MLKTVCRHLYKKKSRFFLSSSLELSNVCIVNNLLSESFNNLVEISLDTFNHIRHIRKRRDKSILFGIVSFIWQP